MRHSRSLDEWDVVSGGESSSGSCSDGELVEAPAAPLPASAIARAGAASESPVMVEQPTRVMRVDAAMMVPSATSASPVLVSPPVAVTAVPPPRGGSAPLRPLALQPHPNPVPMPRVQPARLIDEELTFDVGVQPDAASSQTFLSTTPQVHAAPPSQPTERQTIHAATTPTTVVTAPLATSVESSPTAPTLSAASNPTPPLLPTNRAAASSLPPLLHPPPPSLFAAKPPTGVSTRSASNSSAAIDGNSGSSDGCSGLLIRATSTASSSSSSSSSSSLTPSPTLGVAFTFQPDNNNHATVQLLRSHDIEMGISATSVKAHSASTLVPPTGAKCVTPPDPLLFSPSACFCCQISWRHRVMGFVASFGLAVMLFLLVSQQSAR